MKTIKYVAGLIILLLALNLSPTAASAVDLSDSSNGAIDSEDKTVTFSNSDGLKMMSLDYLGIGSPWTSLGASRTLQGDSFWLEASDSRNGEGMLVINILGSEAVESYSFAVTISGAPAQLTMTSNGGVIAISSSGDFGGYIAAPWGLDALGHQVQTHFEVAGNTLTQVIRHRVEDLTYPVTADPWLGLDLISKVTRSYLAPSSYKVTVAVTPWVGDLYFLNYLAALQIMRTAGWDELLSKVQSSFSLQMKNFVIARPTYEDQWDCHAMGAPVIWATSFSDASPTWDLEGTRHPSTDVALWVSSHCNW